MVTKSIYDAAFVNWGGDWQTPTQSDVQELIDNSTLSVEKINGIYVLRITGLNQNSIVIPYAGKSIYGYTVTVQNKGDIAGYLTSSAVLTPSDGCPPNDYYYSGCHWGGDQFSSKVFLWVGVDSSWPSVNAYNLRAVYKPNNLEDPFNGHEYVDLGVKDEQGHAIYWATCNVGANSPEDYGDYFAWGETISKNSFMRENYFDNAYTEYNISGKMCLESNDDAASEKWGGRWRTPTKEEINQLVSMCTWKWNSVKNCMIVANKNDNEKCICFPLSGPRYNDTDDSGVYGAVWSSTLQSNESVFCLTIDAGATVGSTWNLRRWYGLAIRPVCVLSE